MTDKKNRLNRQDKTILIKNYYHFITLTTFIFLFLLILPFCTVHATNYKTIKPGETVTGEFTDDKNCNSYKFTISHSGDVCFNISKNSQLKMVDFYISDKDDDCVDGDDTMTQWKGNIEKGTYYIDIYPSEDFITGTFTLSFTSYHPSKDTISGNHYFNTAANIKLGKKIYGAISLDGGEGINDFYKFKVKSSGYVNFTRDKASDLKNIDIGVYNKKERLVSRYYKENKLGIYLKKGTYYLALSIAEDLKYGNYVVSTSYTKFKPTIKLSPTKKTIRKNHSFKLKVSHLAKGDKVSKISSKNKNIKIKKIKKNLYKITGKKTGTAIIKVTLISGKTKKCKVKIK